MNNATHNDQRNSITSKAFNAASNSQTTLSKFNTTKEGMFQKNPMAKNEQLGVPVSEFSLQQYSQQHIQNGEVDFNMQRDGMQQYSTKGPQPAYFGQMY